MKHKLKNLEYLHKEIKILRERIEELETSITSTVKPLSDMPKAKGKTNDLLEDYIDRKKELDAKVIELEREKLIAERFIDSIDDSQTRLIFRLRFINGMTWNEVADEVGGGNTEDSVRMRVNRYLEDY